MFSLLAFVLLVQINPIECACTAATRVQCVSSKCCDGLTACRWEAVEQDPQIRKRLIEILRSLSGNTTLLLNSSQSINAFFSSDVPQRKRVIDGVCSCPSAECCLRNCIAENWSSWSPCSTSCGPGLTRRTLSFVPHVCGGMPCLSTVENAPCNNMDCPTPCIVSTWSAWICADQQCEITPRTETRTRRIQVVAGNNGSCIENDNLRETRTCSTNCCTAAVPCAVSSWSSWTSCSATCGVGSRLRTRAVVIDAACNGAPCPPLRESEQCAQALCPVNCELSAWSTWSVCSSSCLLDERRRTRNVVTAPANGGAACDALTETATCGARRCDCDVKDWSTWTTCTASCGSGSQSRSRTIATVRSECPALSDARACNVPPCPQDCIVSAWSNWSSCSAPCGGGRRERTRAATQVQVGAGMPCPLDLTASEECNLHFCADSAMSTQAGGVSMIISTSVGELTPATITAAPQSSLPPSLPHSQSQSQHSYVASTIASGNAVVEPSDANIALIGGIAGGVAALLLVVALVVFIVLRAKRQSTDAAMDERGASSSVPALSVTGNYSSFQPTTTPITTNYVDHAVNAARTPTYGELAPGEV